MNWVSVVWLRQGFGYVSLLSLMATAAACRSLDTGKLGRHF